MKAVCPIRTSVDEKTHVPAGWKWVKLRDVARLESGHTPSRREASYWDDGDVPWLSLKDMRALDGRYVYDTANKPTTKGIANSSARVLPRGTVAFCRTASVGKVAILGRDMATSQDFANWVCSPALDPEYLFEAFRASEAMFNNEKQGTTHKTIYMPVLEQFHVLLAPLPQQRRIAAILDKADAVRRKRREAIGLTEELLRSAFLEMFGDPVANPRGWPRRPLGDAIARFESGWSANGEARQRGLDELGVLKISAVTTGRFEPDEHKAVAAAVVDRELVTPRRGDLLFRRANTRDLVAACCLVERDEPGLFLPDKLWRVVPNPQLAVSEYFFGLFSEPRFRTQLTSQATGTSGSMLNISMEKTRAVLAPMPPLPAQKRFGTVVWQHFKHRSIAAASHKETESLFSSLLHRAFRGEL